MSFKKEIDIKSMISYRKELIRKSKSKIGILNMEIDRWRKEIDNLTPQEKPLTTFM